MPSVVVVGRSRQVIHMEAAVQGLAGIVVNVYRGALESRGARGTAGSGSGTRTLVDGLSLSMTHNHWLAVNHLDLHASLPLQVPDDSEEGRESGPEGEEQKGRALSRGFEAPALDAAKVTTEVHFQIFQYITSYKLVWASGLLLARWLTFPVTIFCFFSYQVLFFNVACFCPLATYEVLAHADRFTIIIWHHHTFSSLSRPAFFLSFFLSSASAAPAAAVRRPRAGEPVH